MRRLSVSGLLAAALIALLVGADARGGDDYTVGAVFSNAAGLIPGQNAEIAGAVVGKVDSIKLTPDHRALVTMKVQTGFAPFRADATCDIKPQSLIGEKFVECDPGTPDAKELGGPNGLPTIPLAHTHAPVDIDLVFAALREPYVNRLSLVVNELGTGVAGRASDLQAAIRRAAPALQESDHVLRIVNQDRALLGQLIDRTDTVLAQVTPRSGDITRFIDHAGRVAAEVGARRDSLGKTIDRLPPLLAQLEPSARSLAGVATDARPLVHQLRQASPSLRKVFGDLAPLTAAGRPALDALASASDEGIKAVRVARPVATKLRAAGTLIPHVAKVGTQMLTSLRAAGGPEGIQTFVWLATAATARFDQYSHIVPSYQIGGNCNTYATTPTAGCSAHWAGSAAARAAAKKPAKKRSHKKHKHKVHKKKAATKNTPAPNDNGLPLPATPSLPKPPPLPKLPDIPGVKIPGGSTNDKNGADKLLDFLMGK